MIYALIGITVFAHLILPFIFLWWIACNKGTSILYRASVALFVTAFLVIMYFGGAGWSWFGSWWAILFLILLIPALILMIKGSKNLPLLPPKKIKAWLGTLIVAVLAIMNISSLPDFFTARSFTEKPIALLFPLQTGTYHIGHGGSNQAMNHHFTVPAQKYALDILKVNKLGIRANGLLPTDLTVYNIFGDQLVAPCTGKVTATENSLEDNTPPDRDPKNILGNNVIIFCNGHSILLAHLKKGSVTVKLGDSINQGDPIGQVGNTGNTTEPHLHLHAVKGNVTDKEGIVSTAIGVPMTFDSKFLIRNDRVSYNTNSIK